MAKESSILNGFSYAVCALGSSLYDNFCSFGKYCDDSLELLGGSRMAQLICMDDQLQQDEKFLSWSKSVIQSAINICGNSRKQNINFVDENSNLFAGMYLLDFSRF